MAGTNVVINIRGDGESAKRALDMVQTKLAETRAKAESESSLIAGAAKMIEHAFANIAVYGTIIEGVEALKQLTLGSYELGESLEKASKKTGLAVETLSTLRYAANVTGTDFDGMTGAVAKMDATIASATQGNKKASAFLKSLGLDSRTLAGDAKGAETAFKAFAQQIAATENPIRRVELARGLLGKQGAEMIPMLIEVGSHWDEFVQKAKRAGVYLSGEQSQQLEETNRRLREMGQMATGAGIAVGEGLGPSLGKMLDIISGGKGSLDTFRQWGVEMARVLAGLATITYSAASGAETLFATFEGGSFTKAGAKDLEAAKQLNRQAQDFLKVWESPVSSSSSAVGGGTPKRGGTDGFGGIGDQSKVKPPKSDDPIVRAAAQLVEEQAKAQAEAQKQATQAMLAELETQHKMLLVSDGDFYAEKLRLQVAALEAEKAALTKQAAELESLRKKQAGDKLLKRDKGGNSAEELRTRREILEIQERIGEVTAKSQAVGSQSNAEVYAAAQAAELARLKQAADLERERDSGIAARLALLARENDLEAAKVRNAGGGDADVAQVQALGEMAAGKLRIAELDRQIRDSEQDSRRAVEALNDAAAKDPRLKTAAAREINQINADEARQLAVLAQRYDALAATLGGDFLEKAKDLHAEVDKLNRPDEKEDAAFTKSLIGGLEELSNKMVETAGNGKKAWHEMTVSMEKDLLRLALKLAEEKWITPMLNGAAGGKLPGVPGARPTFGPGISANPQTSGGGIFASAVGSLGSALKGGGQTDDGTPGPDGDDDGDDDGGAGGGVASGVTGFLGGLGKRLLGGAGGKVGAPGVVINITNTTGADVSASQTGASYDADAKEFVVHAVLENAGSGGLLSHLFGGGSGG